MFDDADIPELIARIRRGDQEAATELVQRYEPLIRRIVRVKLTDKNLQRSFESMDVCQSVLRSFFVRAAVGEYELNDASQLVNLLAAMARNKLASTARREYQQKRDRRRIAQSSDSQAFDHPDQRQETPSMIVAGQELLERAKSLLRDEERQLADLRAAGRSWDEIAAQVGGTAQARRVQFSRAMERITNELELNAD